jgi:hypothetical protein
MSESMKVLIILFLFLSCELKQKSIGSLAQREVAGVAEDSYAPPGSYMFESISLEIKKKNGETIRRSTDSSRNQGSFSIVEGEDYNVRISYKVKNITPNLFEIILERKRMGDNNNLVTDRFIGENHSLDFTPGPYFLKATLQHKEIPDIKIFIDPSLEVRCLNSVKNFVVDKSKVSVTPMCEKDFFRSEVGSFETNKNNCFNLGMHKHDLSQVVTTTNDLSKFYAYYDCDGDDLFDILSIQSITNPVTCYSNFSSQRTARYRIVDQCGNFEDITVENQTTSIRMQPKYIYQTVESEANGDKDVDASQITILNAETEQREYFVQANLNAVSSQDKRVNGTLSLIQNYTQDDVEVKCSISDRKLRFDASSITSRLSSTQSSELTGNYSFFMNFTNVTQNDTTGAYEIDNINFDSISIEIPGQGDVKVNDEITSSNNCTHSARIETKTQTGDCAPGYSGNEYRHVYDIHLDFNCQGLNNREASLLTNISWGEGRCKIGAEHTVKKCEELPCDCTKVTRTAVCADGTSQRQYEETVCQGDSIRYNHCRHGSQRTTFNCPGTNPPNCSCTPGTENVTCANGTQGTRTYTCSGCTRIYSNSTCTTSGQTGE